MSSRKHRLDSTSTTFYSTLAHHPLLCHPLHLAFVVVNMITECDNYFCSEESAEDVKARIVAIQENEIDELREIKRFLELELNFAEQYAEVLKDVKENWVDECVSSFSSFCLRLSRLLSFHRALANICLLA